MSCRCSAREEDGAGQAGHDHVWLHQRHEQGTGLPALRPPQRLLRSQCFPWQGNKRTLHIQRSPLIDVQVHIQPMTTRAYSLVQRLSSPLPRTGVCLTTPPPHRFCLPPLWSCPGPTAVCPATVWDRAAPPGWPCKTWTTDRYSPSPADTQGHIELC